MELARLVFVVSWWLGWGRKAWDGLLARRAIVGLPGVGLQWQRASLCPRGLILRRL